jgi:16S rRNA (guanine527-N7)-methyltransferase
LRDPVASACLQTAAHDMGVELTPAQRAQLSDFAALLRKWNRSFNLVSRSDIARLEQRHILDSLAAVPWLCGTEVLDIGSGAGLPGVPLAVAQPQRRFTLCERHARRARFLSHAALQLNLKNVTVAAADVTTLPTDAGFDTIVARAVAGSARIWGYAAPLLKPGGRVLIFEHAQSGAQTEAEAVELPRDLCVARHEISIPGLAQAHTLLQVQRRTADV